MGGIGISLHSQEGKDAPTNPSTPLVSLPEKIINEIASKLGIKSEKSRAALTSGKIALPDNVEVAITRLSTNDSLTIKKLPGGDTYVIKHKDKSYDVKP